MSRPFRILPLALLMHFAGWAACTPQPADSPSTMATPAPQVEGNATAPETREVTLEQVATSERRWTGITISKEGRLFVNYPRWSEDVPISVAELVDGKPRPYPDEAYNDWSTGKAPDKHWVCVQSVVVDANNRLWVLDPGNPKFGGIVEGAPKLVEIDLQNNEVVRTIPVAPPVVEPSSYLNDVRVDVEHQHAYVTDSGSGALVVVDLVTGKARRLLADHPSTQAEDVTLTIGGAPWLRGGKSPQVHADGIALDARGGYVYYQALTGRHLYRIPTAALRDATLSPAAVAARVEALGETPASDGLLFGADGRIYVSALEHDAIMARSPGGEASFVVKDARIAWPDTFAQAADGHVYFTTAQIHRDEPAEPFRIFRFKP